MCDHHTASLYTGQIAPPLNREFAERFVTSALPCTIAFYAFLKFFGLGVFLTPAVTFVGGLEK